MLGVQEKEAIAEVLEILDYMEEEDKNKIPPKFLEFLKDNTDHNYKKHIDINADINSQISKNKTKAILGMIFYNYLCNENQKKEFEKVLKENEIKKQEELSRSYNYEDLFKKRLKTQEITENLPMVVAKETWYKKLVNTLKRVFHIDK